MILKLYKGAAHPADFRTVSNNWMWDDGGEQILKWLYYISNMFSKGTQFHYTLHIIVWHVIGTSCVSKLELAEARTLPRQAWNRISTWFFWMGRKGAWSITIDVIGNEKTTKFGSCLCCYKILKDKETTHPFIHSPSIEHRSPKTLNRTRNECSITCAELLCIWMKQ